MRWGLLIVALCILSGCREDAFFSIEYINIAGDTVTQSRIADDEYLVYYFLSTDCPLSSNYANTIASISATLDSFPNKFSTRLIFAGDRYTTDEIDSFTTAHHLYDPVYIDQNYELVKLLGARVTPEVFVIDSKGKTLYSGAIDNWAVDLGQKRQVVTEHYLRDAIQLLIDGKKVLVKNRRAVGCFIE